ncbi:MAG TPA: hypothetical protein VNZ86_15270, partial [Bacteroidia bacterium]|nr:hypothetical protein [Bacteroidia bacterium]
QLILDNTPGSNPLRTAMLKAYKSLEKNYMPTLRLLPEPACTLTSSFASSPDKAGQSVFGSIPSPPPEHC